MASKTGVDAMARNANPRGRRTESATTPQRTPRGFSGSLPYPTRPYPTQPYPSTDPFSDRTLLVPTIRTAANAAKSASTDEKTKHLRKVLARVLGSLLEHERFETSADLLDAWKFKLARLRIRYEPADLVVALRRIEAKRPTLNPYGK